MRPSVTNTTTHTPPHTGGKGMCPDTQHILTQKIFFKEERCSRPLYSSHTPHPPPPTTTNSDQQTVSPKQEQPPTHFRMQAPCAAPDTQQCTNNYQQCLEFTVRIRPFTRPASHQPGMCPPGYFTTTVAAPRSGTQPPVPATAGKIKAP